VVFLGSVGAGKSTTVQALWNPQSLKHIPLLTKSQEQTATFIQSQSASNTYTVYVPVAAPRKTNPFTLTYRQLGHPMFINHEYAVIVFAGIRAP
jgi:hypothetical protein